MADIVTKSVRLMDKEIRLYPRVKLDDIVSSVAADGTETIAKLVPQTQALNMVYGTSQGAGNSVLQTVLPWNDTAVANSIVRRNSTGQVTTTNPTSDNLTTAVNLGYANTNYGRLGAGNDWTGNNRFTTGLTVGNNLQYAVHSFGGVAVTQKNSDGITSSAVLSYPAKTGTFALVSDVTTSASNTLTSANAYTDTQINSKLSSALKYKGSKDTYADLPKIGNQVGDTWNVVAAYGNAHAGTNWAWNGTTWDPLGGTIDLSAYVTAPNAFNTAGMFVEVNSTGTNRTIKQSTYAAGAMSTSNHPATMLPNADSVYTFVNSKISGSIWDTTKVVYGETESADTTWGNASMILASKLEDGHMFAKEAYRVQTTMTTTETHDTISTSKAVLDFVMTRFTELNQSISLKVDKKTTTGEYAYVHTGATQTEYKLYGGLVTDIPGGSIPYTDPSGHLAAKTIPATFIAPSLTSLGVTVPDSALHQVLTGDILKSLVSNINSALTQVNSWMITYEEVS